MDNQPLSISGLIFVALLLILIVGINIPTTWAVIISFIGFGLAYYFLNRGSLK